MQLCPTFYDGLAKILNAAEFGFGPLSNMCMSIHRLTVNLHFLEKKPHSTHILPIFQSHKVAKSESHLTLSAKATNFRHRRSSSSPNPGPLQESSCSSATLRKKPTGIACFTSLVNPVMFRRIPTHHTVLVPLVRRCPRGARKKPRHWWSCLR